MSTVQSVGSVSAALESSKTTSEPWANAPGIPPAACFADPVAAALAGIAELSQKAREIQGDLRKAQLALRKQEEKKQVRALLERADQVERGALVASVMLGASSVMYGVAAGTASPEPKVGTAHSPRTPSPPSRLWNAQAGVASQAADVTKSVFDASATRADARGKAAEHAARAADDRAKQHEDDARAAAELTTKAYEAIRAVAQARHAAAAAAAGLRG